MWNELRIELNIGQYLDILGTAKSERSLVTAERIARYKSGKYTIERPLHLGAVLAAPDRADELLPALSAYGLPLGDAFQLRDDVLGAFGDEVRHRQARRRRPPRGQADAAAARWRTARATTAQRGLLARVGAPDLTIEEVRAIQTGASSRRVPWPSSKPGSTPSAIEAVLAIDSRRRSRRSSQRPSPSSSTTSPSATS